MPSNDEGNPKKFIDVIDKDTRENLIRLEQKIKGLQAEIKAKLETLEKYGEEESGRKEQLVLFDSILVVALDGMSGMMDAEINPELTPDEFVETNRSKLDALSNQVTESLNHISKGMDQI